MADHLRQSNESSEEQRGLSAESPQRVAPQESGGREDARRGEAYAGLPRRRADSSARVAARQNVRSPQHARRRGEASPVAAAAPDASPARTAVPATALAQPSQKASGTSRPRILSARPTQSGQRPTKIVDRSTDVRRSASKKSKKCAARSRPERAARVASRLSSAATPRRARRVARLRADAPATRQHAVAAGAASPATPLANAAEELMPMTAAARRARPDSGRRLRPVLPSLRCLLLHAAAPCDGANGLVALRMAAWLQWQQWRCRVVGYASRRQLMWNRSGLRPQCCQSGAQKLQKLCCSHTLALKARASTALTTPLF